VSCADMLAMQSHEFIELESAMNTGSDCVLATQTNEIGWAITPPMSTGLMPSTVAKAPGNLFASANELTGPTVVEKTQKWV